MNRMVECNLVDQNISSMPYVTDIFQKHLYCKSNIRIIQNLQRH